MLKSTLAVLAVAAATVLTAGYQHNQTDPEFLAFSPQRPSLAEITDGTSNTMLFGE